MIRYIAVLLLITSMAQAQVVDIPDPNLRAAIIEKLGKGTEDTITVDDMTRLIKLTAYKSHISDLAGLEHATNLTTLMLLDNNISDISPLIENTGLGAKDIIEMNENPLSPLSINTHIPALENRGVEVID